MRNQLIKHAEKLRFALVGSANTVIDFGLLFGLVFLGLDKIAANFISTGTAFVFSYFFNKSYTFKFTGKASKRQFALFLIITIFGLWVLQPIVIYSVSLALGGLGIQNALILLIAKLLATAVTLVWNYVLYKKYVFRSNK